MRSIPALIALVAVISLAAFSGATADAKTVTVDAGNNYFCSSDFEDGICTTTVVAGDAVTWTVSEGIHTVTECDSTHTACPPAGGGFDSDILQTGESFSQTFATAGTFYYYCALHPTQMQGAIVVQEPTPSPTPTPATTAPGATPAVASQTAGPAVVPQTGGAPVDGGGTPSMALLMALGGILAVSGAVAALAARRR